MTYKPRIPPTAQEQDAPRRVELLVFEDVQLLDLSGPLQVFASCNDLLKDRGRPPAYATCTVSRAGGAIRTSSGLGISTETLSLGEPRPDTLIVCGGAGVHAATRDLDLLSWLQKRSGHANRTASVCTGAFLLAATGLLDGKRAVTHWASCAIFAQSFPAVNVEPDPVFIEDGGVWTSAGVTAGIDLALTLVERDLGREIALAVARHLVVYLKRPGGQAQFSTALDLQRGTDKFDQLHGWMREHLDADLRVSALASQAGMSERSFARRYREMTGATPARAVERVRVEAAQNDLCSSSLSVKEIARRCGFGSEETMRRSFLRQAGVGPSGYRERFGSSA